MCSLHVSIYHIQYYYNIITMVRCPYLFLDIWTQLVTNECKCVFRHTKVFLPPLSPKHTTLDCLPPMVTARSILYRSTYVPCANMLQNSSNDDPRFVKHKKFIVYKPYIFWIYGTARPRGYVKENIYSSTVTTQ